MLDLDVRCLLIEQPERLAFAFLLIQELLRVVEGHGLQYIILEFILGTGTEVGDVVQGGLR